MTRGFLLIALGHPYYGNYAFNLAASILAYNPDAKISVVVSYGVLSHLRASQVAMFDQLIECPKEAMTYLDGVSYVKPKLYAFDLSPYDETILLDVDVCWCPNVSVSDVFDSLSYSKFQIKNTGHYDVISDKRIDNPKYTYWNDPKEICRHFNIKDKLYCCQGEFIYFDKSNISRLIFRKSIEVFDKSKMGTSTKFAGLSMNDEFAFNVALAQVKYQMPKSPYTPTFWAYLDGFKMTRTDIHLKYMAVSAGGTSVGHITESHYNDIIGNAYRKIGLQYKPFRFIQKSSFLPERRK